MACNSNIIIKIKKITEIYIEIIKHLNDKQ